MTAMQLPLPSPHVYSAVISGNGWYRYELTRAWGHGQRLTWIMLNPSIADAENDDPTVRRVRGFTRSWGYPGFTVVNLFAHRATYPSDLRRAREPVGPENDERISRACLNAARVVVAWGGRGALYGRDRNVLRLVDEANVRPWCLGRTKDGHPRHPLYVAAATSLMPYESDRGRRPAS